jgi:hypothetical protein
MFKIQGLDSINNEILTALQNKCRDANKANSS